MPISYYFKCIVLRYMAKHQWHFIPHFQYNLLNLSQFLNAIRY